MVRVLDSECSEICIGFNRCAHSKHLPAHAQVFRTRSTYTQSLLPGLSSDSSGTWFIFAGTLTLPYGD